MAYKILLVDDEPTILNGLNETIDWAYYGLEVAGMARDGIEALEIMSRIDIRILITDIRMPNMDGLELLRRIREAQKDVKAIILSAYDDFDYIRNAIRLGIENYILKPLDEKEITSTLLLTIAKIESENNRSVLESKGSSVLMNNVLLRWVMGEIGIDELEERTRLLGIDIRFPETAVAVVRVLEREGEASDEMRRAVYHTFTSFMEQTHLGIVLFDLDGDVLVVFTGRNRTTAFSDYRDSLDICRRDLEHTISEKLFITLGDVQKESLSVDRSYYKAKRLQDYRMIVGGSATITSEDAVSMSLATIGDLPLDTDSFDRLLTAQDRSGAFDFVRNVFDSIPDNPASASMIRRNLTIEILLRLIQSARTLGIVPERLYDSFADLSCSTPLRMDARTIVSRICQLIDEVFNTVRARDDRLHPVIKQVVTYLGRHYADNINLKTVAQEFNLSSVYLGHLFSKELHSPFNGYINRLRIEKAKQLLASGNVRTTDVGRRVGYSNGSYFSTIFKKMTGMSPSEFR